MKIAVISAQGFRLAGMSLMELYEEHSGALDGTDYEIEVEEVNGLFVATRARDGKELVFTEGRVRSLLVHDLLEYHLENSDPEELERQINVDDFFFEIF